MTEMIGRVARALQAYALPRGGVGHTARIEAAIKAADGMPGLELPRMLVLSTGHITSETAALLNAKVGNRMTHACRAIVPIVYEKGEYGYILPLIDEDDDRKRWAGISDLSAIRALAETVGATWIMLDRDADTVEGLPVYEW